MREINKRCREKKGDIGREEARVYFNEYRQMKGDQLRAADVERYKDPARKEAQRQGLIKLKSDPAKRRRYLDQVRAHNHRRRAASGSYTVSEWQALLLYYDGKCLCCGTTENIQVDHVVPLSKGGTNTIDNLQPLCKACNRQKMTKTIDYRLVVF